MPRPHVQDLRVVRDLTRELSVWSGGASAMESLLPPLTELLGARTGATYGVDEADGGFRLRFVNATGDVHPGYASVFERVLAGARRGTARRFGFFDPDRPEAWQRNKVLDFHDLEARGLMGLPAMGEAGRAMGIAMEGQLRVLVCDGPHLLALVGLYRTEPWQPRERRLLARLVPGVARRLGLERALGSSRLLEAAFGAAMEGIPGVAFVLDARGHIVHANAAGEAALDSGTGDLRLALEEAAASPRAPSRFRLTPVVAPGAPRHFLAIGRTGATSRALAASAAERWSLTPRQALVLAWLVEGATNARIGAELAISERTVEVHVAAIMGRAECHTRAMLIAAVLRQQ
jgi:DNA-binding CsgD family transcriptional regulator